MPRTSEMTAIRISITITLPAETNSTKSVIIRPRPVERDGADHDAGGRGRNRDADHVARAERQPVDQIVDRAARERAGEILAAEQREQGLAGRKNADDGDRRPEGRQAGRHLLDHQAPEQHDQRNDKIDAGARHVPGVRQMQDRRVRIIELEIRESARRTRRSRDRSQARRPRAPRAPRRRRPRARLRCRTRARTERR